MEQQENVHKPTYENHTVNLSNDRSTSYEKKFHEESPQSENNESFDTEKLDITNDNINHNTITHSSDLNESFTNKTYDHMKETLAVAKPTLQVIASASSTKNNIGNSSSPPNINKTHVVQREANSSDIDVNNEIPTKSHINSLTDDNNIINHDKSHHQRIIPHESQLISKTKYNISQDSKDSFNVNNNDQNHVNSNKRINADKPNGLRNRLRPPPIDIGKVSNFTIDDRPFIEQEVYSQARISTYNPEAIASVQKDNPESPDIANLQKSLNIQRPDRTNTVHNNWPSSSTNLKFWSKLNDSYNPVSTDKTANNTDKLSMADSHTDANTTKSSNNEKTRLDDGKKIDDGHGNNNNINRSETIRSLKVDHVEYAIEQSNLKSSLGIDRQQIHDGTFAQANDVEVDTDNIEAQLNSATSHHLKSHEPSTGSEHDESSTHGGDVAENDGGNVIGVDNPTPPASANLNEQVHEKSTSAINVRSKSNNPFLVSEDELISALPNLNNFHRRPASFMAATTSNIKSKQQATLDNVMNRNQHDLCEGLSHLNIISNDAHENNAISASSRRSHEGNWNDVTQSLMQKSINEHPYKPHIQDKIQDERYIDMCSQMPLYQNDRPDQSIYGGSYNIIENNQANFTEPTISTDSENAVGKLPPSATLPHWIDAIYELNNAILEPASIGGGAENGQFIYLKNSGDIILELNQIKISGFTLAEFNELVESKPTHLLSAVQTKHSHSLTCDLKEYLKCSFPKNSPDKLLQDLIRENIYRRTIPCTTRPPRPGEVDKIDYHFLTIQQFNDLNERGLLLECGIYGPHHYGTLRPSCEFEKPTESAISNTSAIDLVDKAGNNCKLPNIADPNPPVENQIYENQIVFRQHQQEQNQNPNLIPNNQQVQTNDNFRVPGNNIPIGQQDQQLPLPHGWEKVEDPIHGTFYIDHNTQKTQYERPYEIELIKGYMGFGFTLVEADNGLLLVRSIIHDGPAYHNGIIKPGDILISAVGISVSVLQHTDIAKLFSAFAVGDRVRLTFGRTSYVLGDNLANLVPDEYLFSNGSNGDMAFAINPAHPNFRLFQDSLNLQQQTMANLPNLDQEEYDMLKISLKKNSDQGFGFTLGESVAGQKVKEIQNASACIDLKQGDTLMNINQVDVTQMAHKDVVSLLKECPVGEMINLTIKRRTRFRSKTPLVTHSDYYRSSMIHPHERNCRTPSFDGMIDRYHERHSISSLPRGSQLANTSTGQYRDEYNQEYMSPTVQGSFVPPKPLGPSSHDESIYYKNHSQIDNSVSNVQIMDGRQSFDGCSMAISSVVGCATNEQANGANHQQAVDGPNCSTKSLYSEDYKHTNEIAQINRYNNFMKNDKLMMMQMQQQKYQHNNNVPQEATMQPIEDYQQLALYSNAELIRSHSSIPCPPVPKENCGMYGPEMINYLDEYQNNNYYANNEEIAMQRSLAFKQQQQQQNASHHQSKSMSYDNHDSCDLNSLQHDHIPFQPDYRNHNNVVTTDEFEYHNIDLIRENINSNWGIRLIGGAEVNRAISIGSVVFGGAAFENGRLKSGDEIISINGIDVVGATHQNVVELISSCANQASLQIRRKRYAEACEVILTRSLDEGFGFVIISSCDCVSLIGKIIEGSPAQRCQQLHVKDRIIAVNGREITPKMRHSEIVNMIKETGSVLRLKIIPANCYTVELIKNSPNDNFGFTMRGGSEYDGAGLYILRVAPTGLARDLLNVGDQIIEINEIPTVGMTHQQAASIIMHSDPIVKLKLRRNHQIPPSLLVDSPRELHKFNQVTAEIKTISMTSSGKSDRNCEDSIATPPNNFIPATINQQQPQSNAYQQDNDNDLVHQNNMPLYAT